MNTESLFVVVVVLLVFGFTSILGLYITEQYIDAFNQTGFYTGKAVEAGEGFLFTLRLFDYITVLIMIVLIIGLAITSYKIATPGVFFVSMIIMGSLYGLIAYFFNFLFQSLVSDPVFTATLLYFPRTILICKNLHWVMLIEIIVGSITLWGKKPEGQFLS